VGPVWEDADGEEIVNETFTRLEKAFHAIFSERDAVASNLLRASVTSFDADFRRGHDDVDGATDGSLLTAVSYGGRCDRPQLGKFQFQRRWASPPRASALGVSRRRVVASVRFAGRFVVMTKYCIDLRRLFAVLFDFQSGQKTVNRDLENYQHPNQCCPN